MPYKLMLRELRKSRKMTQGDLAKALGVSDRIVGAWERGETDVPLDEAFRLCDALGCSPNELCGWYDDHPNEECLPLTSDEAELLGNYRSSEIQWKANISMTARAAAGESRADASRGA